MEENGHRIIHSFLIEEGFVCSKNIGDVSYYQGEITISNYIFVVEISFFDESFIEVPKVKVITWPNNKGFPKTLPHVYEEGRLCYIDSESIVLDRYDPYSSFYIIFEHIKELLKSFLPKNNKNLSDEFANEFTAYWNRDCFQNHAYLRSFNKNCVASIFEKDSLIETDSKTKEVIIHVDSDKDKQLNHWLDQRNVIKPNTSEITQGKNPNGAERLCDVIFVKVRKPCLIPINSNWPPNSTEELLLWLNEIDQGTANHLSSRIEQVIHGSNKLKKTSKNKYKKSFNKKRYKKQLSVFVILSTQSGHVGILIKYNESVATIIANNFGRNKKTGRRSLLKILSSVGSTQIRNIKNKENAIHVKERIFARYSVSDATDSRVITRNLENENSLSGKKIALIGCGTVGGYAAMILNQTGAGVKDESGRGCLHLYDSDLLSIDNIGRHVLNLSYVGLNKADSLAHFLQSRSFSEKTEITGFSDDFSQNKVSSLNKHDYDLIIDLTGSDVFSTTLNHEIHTLNKKVPVLYAANYLGGKAVRAFLDDGSDACFRCLRTDKAEDLYQKFPLLKKDQPVPEPINRQCGATYFPYASAASTASASLVQQLSLDFFSGNPSPRFRHLSLSSEIRYTKNQNPTKAPNCPCCSI